ncbi:MAG: ribosome biogenesis GTPase Der [Alphaproteobacteria bacterium]|nr:MAG: ribosome biogenesis GTPase Der [Alphaproteobacteria bacterium]
MFNIAIFGRPNVGKSTLFNALVGKKKAIVSNVSGVTVDRNYGIVKLNDISFNLIDTAGILDKALHKNEFTVQTLKAIEDADLVFFVTDYSSGILPYDFELSSILRKTKKNVIHLVNKFDAKNNFFSDKDAIKIGFKEIIYISSEHKKGFDDIYNSLIKIENFRNSENITPLNFSNSSQIRISFIGKPNAGKSSLINTILGHKRLVTGSKPGITRDSIQIPFSYKNKNFSLIDTAGMRRKAKINNFVEKQSVSKSMLAIRMSDIVILVLDSTDKLNKQDLILAKRAIDYGKSIIISLNKWDLIEDKINLKKYFSEKIKISLSQLNDVKILPTSCFKVHGIDKLLEDIISVYDNSHNRISTSDLNKWFKFLSEKHPVPMVKGKKNSLKYISQVEVLPPRFIIFCSYPKDIPSSYVKYIKNNLKKAFNFKGVNIVINLKKTLNPFTNQ